MRFSLPSSLLLSLAFRTFWLTDSTVAAQNYAPGDASWLGGDPAWDDTPTDYESYFPIVYVVFGRDGSPHVRSIVGEEDDCPVAFRKSFSEEFTAANGAAYAVRATGNLVNDNMLPYKFPIKVCSITADSESDFTLALDAGDVVVSYKDSSSHVVPRVKLDPKRFLLTGDTGMRSKPKNLGLGALGKGNCTAPEVYGIPQCAKNFTEADLTEQPTGSFQDTNEWIFGQLADAAASKEPDVIVYVGDYLYRQGPCPFNATDSMTKAVANCSGINMPEIATSQELPPDLTMNFLPGYYGDNWWGWWADFFWPAMKLLQQAPLIPTRGNHEVCTRGGYGYFIFLSPLPLCPTCEEQLERICSEAMEPYPVSFKHEQFLVMDDSHIAPNSGGIDHFQVGFSGTCLTYRINAHFFQLTYILCCDPSSSLTEPAPKHRPMARTLYQFKRSGK
jgi:hypothetical protein